VPNRSVTWSARASGLAVPGRVLADTGALVAFLSADDPWHAACVDAYGGLRLPLVTSAAVLTELFHFVGDQRRAVSVAWRFVRSGALQVEAIGDADLPRLEALMSQYHDRPMDFADATLVHLAQRLGIATVFTIDHDDFETYRAGRKRFRIVPPRLAPRAR
jgi:uncharacterized protein